MPAGSTQRLALSGGLNAALITKLRLPPLIVTLGTYSLFRGLAEYADPARRDVFLTLAAAEEGIFTAYHALLGSGDHAIVEIGAELQALVRAAADGARHRDRRSRAASSSRRRRR